MAEATGSSLAKRLRSREARLLLGMAIILVSAGFLAYFIYRNWPALSAHSWDLNYSHLALTMVWHLLAFVIAITAWHSIIGRLAGSGNLLLNARIYCYSAVARRLPGVAWDIATRLAMYDYAGVSKAVVGVASMLEWLIITVSGILLYAALLPFTTAQSLNLGFWPLFGIIALGGVLTHPRFVTFAVRKAKRGEVFLPLRYQDTLWWLFAYGWTWIISGLMLYATIRSVYPLASSYLLQLLGDWILVGIVTSFVSFVPTSMALREVTLTLLMSRYMPEHIAVVAAILMRILTVAYSILWTICLTRLSSVPNRPTSVGQAAGGCRGTDP
jgi:hypothetical protein